MLRAGGPGPGLFGLAQEKPPVQLTKLRGVKLNLHTIQHIST